MEALLQWLGLFAKFTRLPIAAIAIASAFALFAPSGWLSLLSVRQVINDNRSAVGIAFLLSASTLGAAAIQWLWQTLSAQWESYRIRQGMKQTLEHLTNDEKQMLQPFILQGRESITVPMTDGIAAGLRAKRILYNPTNIGHAISGFAFNMQPPVRLYLSKHPELLETPEVAAQANTARGNAGRRARTP